MKQNNNDKFIRATPATVLKTYKAPRLTSYGDISVLTKANAGGKKVYDAIYQSTASKS